MSINIIHILGASGSGTTTLAKALEKELGYKCLDSDDYFWLPTATPFSEKRPVDERVSMMNADIEKNPKCVISGSLCGWGDVFLPMFDLVIYMFAPSEIRKERLIKREHEHFGERIREGGDMYQNHTEFIEWAMSYDTGGVDMRSAKMHKLWLEQITCPILRLNGTDEINALVGKVSDFVKSPKL